MKKYKVIYTSEGQLSGKKVGEIVTFKSDKEAEPFVKRGLVKEVKDDKK